MAYTVPDEKVPDLAFALRQTLRDRTVQTDGPTSDIEWWEDALRESLAPFKRGK